MKHPRSVLATHLHWLSLVLSLAACDPVTPRRDGGRSDAGPATDTLADAGRVSASPLVGLEITPAMTETLVRNGIATPVSFIAVGLREDGTRDSSFAVTWSVDTSALGTISATGVFTPNGQVGGSVQIAADAMAPSGMLHATATLTVRISSQTSVGAVDAATITRIEAATPGTEAAPSLVYPLDQAVMPQNVFAPNVQWTPTGAATDVFRIRLSKPSVEVTAYVVAGSADYRMHHWLVDRGGWRALTDSDLGSPVTLTITRWNAATSQLTTTETRTVQISRGAISGALYYWSVQQGRVMRINPAAGMAEQVNAGSGCVACHSVSRDGRYLAASLQNDVIGGVFDLTSSPATPTFASSSERRFTFSTFSPDSTRLLVNRINPDGAGGWTDARRLALIDPQTGNEIVATGLPATPLSMADWSPDGTGLAVITNITSMYNRSDIFERGDLALMPALGGDAFGAVTLLHSGASLASAPEGGNSDMHPTWSPDSNLIAFAHGTEGRATQGGSVIAGYFPGALYLTPRAGGAAMRLDRANGGATGSQSYWPTFSPFITLTPDAGGRYFWLAYFTPQPYGNHPPASSPPPSQIWVTAIDANPTAGTDPSHTPYWLPGQDTTQHNIDAHWTALACRANGTDCASSSECCSGVCLSPGGGAPSVCTPPPATSCRVEGSSCGGSGDCCSGLTCVGNACVPDIL